MPHTYNRSAFRIFPGMPLLLEAYSRLVVIELAFKDNSLPWKSGHKIIDWVNNAGEAALSVQLLNKLGTLFCTDRSGNESVVHGNAYPDLRYLRHETDFPTKSTDVQLQELIDIIKDVESAIVKKGVVL